MKRSPMKPRTKPMKRGAIKKRAPKRETETMGSRERRAFVASLPCAACGIVGYSQNAHLLGNGGMGAKKHFDTIGPLCGSRYGIVGCHRMYDEMPWTFDERFPDFNAAWVADHTERLWQQHQRRAHDPEPVGSILDRVLSDALQHKKVS